MTRKKILIEIVGPVMSGSISLANSTCGKPNCACKAKPPQLHGPFYRWTGMLQGKRTTKTISQENARECERRIKNYKKLLKKIDEILKNDLKEAPWHNQ